MPIGPGAYDETVALIGIGAVSRYLLKLLRPFNFRVIAYSDSSSDFEARELGVDELVDIETCFREAIAISNHLVDRPETLGIFQATHFASMRKGATFINTGRGAQVDEDALTEVFKSRRDLTAWLDVQHPEPPGPDSLLYTLPNVYLSSHIAGSANNELYRMSAYMIDDFVRWKSGLLTEFKVNKQFFV